MGKVFTKFGHKTTDKRNDEPEETLNDETDSEKQLNILRNYLENKMEIFLLNNLLLSVQFFKNYDREIVELRSTFNKDRESQLNESLRQHQKHVVLPDKILEFVSETVRFKPQHGPNKNKSQPLSPQRMFVFHDNMEVVQDHTDIAEYSVIGGPIHTVMLTNDWGTKTPGYVFLERIQTKYADDKNSRENSSDSEGKYEEKPVKLNNSKTPSPVVTPTKPIIKYAYPSSPSINLPSPSINLPSPSINLSSPSINLPSPSPLKEVKFNFDEKKVKSTSFSNIKPKDTETKRPLSLELKKTTDTDTANEEDYQYTTITNMSISRSLDEVREGSEVQNISNIPNKCFEKREFKRPLRPEDLSDDEEDEFDMYGRRRPPIKKKPIQLYETKCFVNSQKFFAHFGDVFQQLYSKLGFTEKEKTRAVSQKSVIYINVDGENFINNYEVYPAVFTPWPVVANEWTRRKRKAYLYSSTVVKWPRKVWVDNIRKKIGAAVLPIGYINKRGPKGDFELQWSVAFPAVERFLDLRMTHGQTRCYLFILTLYKSFMELPEVKLGLQPYHIKTVILWESEKNCMNWQDEILGDKMYQVLVSLYESLSQANLQDYFIPSKNLFADIPRKYLMISQEKLHKIIENPFIYTFVALRNLTYTSGDFFPRLDFKMLYTILTTENILLLDNPQTRSIIGLKRDFHEEIEEVEDFNEFKENAIPFWQKQQNMERNKKRDFDRLWNLKSWQQYENTKKKKEKKNTNEKKVSVDSINLELNCEKIQFDSNRTRKIIEFFINHFIEMAKYSLNSESFVYTKMYINYSHLLRNLLMEIPSGQVLAGDLLGLLVALGNKYEIARRRHYRPPELPIRTRNYSSSENVSYGNFDDINRPSTSRGRIQKESVSKENEHTVIETSVDHHNDFENNDDNQNASSQIINNDEPILVMEEVPKKKRPKTLQELLNEEIEMRIENNEIPVIDSISIKNDKYNTDDDLIPLQYGYKFDSDPDDGLKQNINNNFRSIKILENTVAFNSDESDDDNCTKL